MVEMWKDKSQDKLFFEGEEKGFSVNIKGTEGRVNLFENMFHMSFPIQCECDPQSKILKKVNILERIFVGMNTRKIANVDLMKQVCFTPYWRA